MQRSHLLRWLALAIGLLGTQCLDSISDDCTKTLTCEDDPPPVLKQDCTWEYPDGRPWPGGPHYDRATSTWRWPDGKATKTQEFDCNLNFNVADAGVDAGPTGPDCRVDSLLCDEGLTCDPATGSCVQCVTNAECAGNMPMGDAGAATVCDTASHRCVACVIDNDCSGDTSVCKVDASNSRRNRCVECLTNATCGDTTPICDDRSNECTSSCQSSTDCTGDKPACNTTRNICVECTENGHCTTPGEALCDTESNLCVECLDDGQCAANVSAKVCDLETHSCVQCREDAQCTTLGLGYCETDAKACVQCLNDVQCTTGSASRCNAAHVCTGCTDSNQCEEGAQCRNGTCVECLNPSHCADTPDTPFCESTKGICVACLNNGECRSEEAAHCETNVGLPLEQRYRCVNCVANEDCTGDGKGLPPFCDPDKAGGTCVECITSGDCSGFGPTRSRCQNSECVRCSEDRECGLFPSTLACNPDLGCVQCTNNDHCTDVTKPICKLVAGGGSAAVNTCVECTTNDNCRADASASLCQNNQCVPCVQDADCNGVDSNGNTAGGTPLNVCDAGTCVECTGPKNAACANSTVACDSRLKTCSPFAVRTAELCQTCVSDNHCEEGLRCATHLFGTTPLGPFCFPVATGPASNVCNLTPYSGLTALTSLDGVSANLCLLRRTTCAGLADFNVQACDAAADCGADGLDDGRCDEGSGTCSVPCTTNVDCFDPETNSCLGGLCQL